MSVLIKSESATSWEADNQQRQVLHHDEEHEQDVQPRASDFDK